MNFFANRVLCIFLLIAATKYSATNDLESTENIEDFLNSIIQFRHVSGTLEQYATQVRSLFCPEQPVCGDSVEKNRTDVLRNVSIFMGFGTNGTRIEDVINVVGACCLPCSCDLKTCTEYGNCCPSKLITDVVSSKPDDDVLNVPYGVSDSNDTFSRLRGNDTKPIYSESIKAIRDSYVDKDVFHITGFYYS